MVKKYFINILLAILFLGVVSLIFWQHKKNRTHIPEILLGSVSLDVVEVKSKVTGKLVSAQEIEVKSSVSGIIETLFVEVGDSVVMGTPIARIKPAPEPEELENARKNLKTCEIEFEMEESLFIRKKGLELKGGISPSELESAQRSLELRELELKAAQKKLRLLLEGYLDYDQKENNLIVSSSRGVVTELPVKAGQSIIKRTTQTEGTTIAVVSDMSHLVFRGQLGEYEISKLKPQMPLTFYFGAYEGLICSGRVLRIDPQALKGQSNVLFNFEASIDFPFDSVEVKTGLTVVSEFTVAQTDSVLCIDEKYINYSGDSIFVELAANGKQAVKRLISIGLSNGIKTEVVSGLSKDDKLIPVDWNQ